MHVGLVHAPHRLGGAGRPILEAPLPFGEHADRVHSSTPDYSPGFVDRFALPDVASTDASVGERIGGYQGVTAAEPAVSTWADCPDELIDLATHGPDTAAVPTWQGYCGREHGTLRTRGVP